MPKKTNQQDEQDAFNPPASPAEVVIKAKKQSEEDEQDITKLDTPEGRFHVYMIVSPTGFEKKVWSWLGKDMNPWRLTPQVEKHGYILDFYSEKHRLCIEADGPDHLFQVEADKKRDSVLLAKGIRTLRLRPIDFVKYKKNTLVAVIEEFIDPRHDVKRSNT